MKTTRLGVLCAGILMAIGGAAQAIPISGQGTWETTLQGRDLDGDFFNGFEAYYDTVLNITWLADANYTRTSGYDADGQMTWAAANAWAANLVLGGFGQWRLPLVIDTGAPGCDQTTASGADCGVNVNTSTSEMAHMYYVSLGNLPQTSLSNTGPFSNLQPSFYWSGTAYTGPGSSSGSAWMFSFRNGEQNWYWTYWGETLYAWAVHPGDIGTPAVVPVPAAIWLFGSGLLGLLSTARGRH